MPWRCFLIVMFSKSQIAKIGVIAETTTGQIFLPVYKLAPLRILVTFIGVIVAFLFTLFPLPVTAKDLLRQNLAQQFQLLATIFGITHARFSALVHPYKREDPEILRHALNKVTLEYLGLQNRSTQNLLLTTWEPSFRYQFPRSVYSNLLNSMQRDKFPISYNLIVVFLTCTSSKTIASLVWKVPGWKRWRARLDETFSKQ
jgi:hypothetical protein